MTTREQKPYISLIINVLNKISTFSKSRKSFMSEAFILFLSIKGRINFLQLGRYGTHGEQRYRQQFEKPFPFMDFNKELVLSHGSGRYAIAFDPSYISKSGKNTPGVGWYWSGCAGQAKWGLEIGGIAAIDVDNHTAFHLEAVQTLPDKENDKRTCVHGMHGSSRSVKTHCWPSLPCWSAMHGSPRNRSWMLSSPWTCN